MKSAIYGRKSEQYSKEEGIEACLFNEAEAAVDESTESNNREEITVAAPKRVKGGRRPLPPGLPRVEVIPDLSESEKICDCREEMSRIGFEVSEKLDIVPAKARARDSFMNTSLNGRDGDDAEDRTYPYLRHADEKRAQRSMFARVRCPKRTKRDHPEDGRDDLYETSDVCAQREQPQRFHREQQREQQGKGDIQVCVSGPTFESAFCFLFFTAFRSMT